MIRRIGAVLMLAAFTSGCVGGAVTRDRAMYRLALVSESYATGLERLQRWEIGEHTAGRVADADHRIWQRRIERLATYGKAANEAIRTGQLATVQMQARAIIDILGELVDEQVIKMTDQQKLLATVVLEAMRTAVLVWSATMDVKAIGDPDVLDAIAMEAA